MSHRQRKKKKGNLYLEELVEGQLVVHAPLIGLDDKSSTVGGQAEVPKPRRHKPERKGKGLCWQVCIRERRKKYQKNDNISSNIVDGSIVIVVSLI